MQKALRGKEMEAQAARQRLEQFFEAIEASPNGVLLLDTDDQIDWCNRAAADHFGIDPVRDLGQPVTNLVRAPAFVTFLQGARFEDGLVYSDARGPGTLSLKIRPYGEGMTLVISEDVTERARNDAMRRDFVANVSHEIRTPLTVLAGFVETLQTLKLSAVEHTRIVELMSQQTQRMQALVSDLLTLARLEGSPRPAPDHWVPVASLLSRVQSEAEALSSGRHRISVSPAREGVHRRERIGAVQCPEQPRQQCGAIHRGRRADRCGMAAAAGRECRAFGPGRWHRHCA